MTKSCECGRPIDKPRCTRCELCRRSDPHRNGHRHKANPEMIVSVDGEGCQTGTDMRMVSISYGREDGTSASLSNLAGLTGQDAARWLIDELSGPYTDAAGKVWKQAVMAFHFNWDTGVISKDFTDDMTLVHRAGARKTNLLCNTEHDPGDTTCGKIHRYNDKSVQAVISDGGEGDLLALHTPTGIGLAGTPKRRLYLEHRPHGDRYEEHRVLDIHDNGSAFVGGLLDVIAKWQPELNVWQQAAIKWGKEARKDGFLHGSIEEIEEYSEAECIAHARCSRLLINAIRDAAQVIIRPSKLFGSGSVAAAAFKFHQVPTRTATAEDTTKVQGVAVDDLAKLTYFGGLIETPVLGLVVGAVDEVDLNSAYPAKAVELPCMKTGHGRWHRQRGHWNPDTDPGPHTVGHVLATWAVQTPSTPPFNVRVPGGLVRCPLAGRAWVTLVEFQEARRRFGDDVTCSQAVWWVPECDCPNPLGWLADLYQARLALKGDMKKVDKGGPEWQALNCRQEAIKLIINSCYGKLAQQLPELGKYTNLHWAAYVTGGTRAAVRAETWAREDQGGTVVYQHTDSVLSTGGTPTDGGPELGAWGMEKPSRDLLITQPGLATALGGGKTATRGCGKDAYISAARAWAEQQDLTQHPTTWQPMIVQRDMMISRRMAVARGKPEQAGAFVPTPLAINFNSAKRAVDQARPVPGIPTAWIIPPVQMVTKVATLEDIKQHKTDLARRLEAGDFDDLTPTPDGHTIFSSPAQSEKIDALMARGYDFVDAYAEIHGLDPALLRSQQTLSSVTGGTVRGGLKALREAYAEQARLAYLDAEAATRGNLLSKAGKAKKIDPRSLFVGRAPARRYVSDELLEWWETHPRLTFTEYRRRQ